jgi:predicted DNA-binding protein with PD1-like motif
MKTRDVGESFVIVLERGEELFAALSGWAGREEISHASFFGIGALEAVTIGYYDLPQKQYRFNVYSETFEVASMQGNITQVDGKPFIHAHTVLSRCDTTLACIGGHLKEARVAVTLEIHLRRGEGALVRLPDDTIGLNLISP